MPFIHYASKQAARRAQRVFLLGAAQFGVLAEVLGAVPGAVVGRASSGAIATAMGYLGVEAAHAAEIEAHDRLTPRVTQFLRCTRGLGDRASTRAFHGEHPFPAQARNHVRHMDERVSAVVVREELLVAGFDWFWRLLNPTDGTAFRNARWMVETVRPPLAPAAEPFALGPLTDAPWTDWSGAWEHDDAEYQPYLRLG